MVQLPSRNKHICEDIRHADEFASGINGIAGNLFVRSVEVDWEVPKAEHFGKQRFY